MPIYNFKTQFAGLVLHGTKRQTLRARGKRPAPVTGQIAHCYTGLRTQSVRILGKYPIVSVASISISITSRTVRVDGQRGAFHDLTSDEIEQLARDDGFASADDFFDFFRSQHGATFSGYLIKW